MRISLASLVAVFLMVGCDKTGTVTSARQPGENGYDSTVVLDEPARAAGNPASRKALYGDLHMHTGWSFDAWGMLGVQTTPRDAYLFASGRPVNYMGHPVIKDRPLDFMAVTDHSEYLAVLGELDDPDSELSRSEFGEAHRGKPFEAFMSIHKAFTQGEGLPQFDYAALSAEAWQRTVEAANEFNAPGTFTAFIGYEWTSMPKGIYNLHRNVIFRGDSAPLPFDSSISQNPEDLWTWMETQRERGHQLLAIPHNSNASGGYMFEWVTAMGEPIDETYAKRRRINEPLVEVFQGKGQSETLPVLSGADEFANFEVLETLLTDGEISKPEGSYARDALGRGLVIERRTGENPYKFGMIGSTDFHNALSTSEESEFAGKNLGIDIDSGMIDKASVAKTLDLSSRKDQGDKDWTYGDRKPLSDIVADPTTVGSGGLAAVWAEENTRDSIFAALERREVFATSGTRMRIRFFAGWDYSDDILGRADWLDQAYGKGVPMGAVMASPPISAEAPRFLVWGMKDPEGANLDRLQVIKVWLDGEDYREKVFDVALSDAREYDPVTGGIPPVGNTVDLDSGTYSNTIGAPQLSALWSDPGFDPDVPAVYYARAIEIPTPRWTTLLASRFQLPVPDNGRPTLQERALSSPIWYRPSEPAANSR